MGRAKCHLRKNAIKAYKTFLNHRKKGEKVDTVVSELHIGKATYYEFNSYDDSPRSIEFVKKMVRQLNESPEHPSVSGDDLVKYVEEDGRQYSFSAYLSGASNRDKKQSKRRKRTKDAKQNVSCHAPEFEERMAIAVLLFTKAYESNVNDEETLAIIDKHLMRLAMQRSGFGGDISEELAKCGSSDWKGLDEAIKKLRGREFLSSSPNPETILLLAASDTGPPIFATAPSILRIAAAIRIKPSEFVTEDSPIMPLLRKVEKESRLSHFQKFDI